MKKFKFKLQTLLEQRQAVEDGRLRELADLRREEAVEVDKLAKLQDDLQGAWNGIISAIATNASAEEMGRRDDYARTVRDDLKLQELTLAAVRERVEAKRLELIEAMKERKVLETLKENQEHAYVVECERKDRNTLDDLASVKYARSGRHA